jgi:hypothetical protein
MKMGQERRGEISEKERKRKEKRKTKLNVQNICNKWHIKVRKEYILAYDE